jgi:hypothetical protein
MERVLASKLSAHQSCELIVPTLVVSGMEVISAPLVDFLTVILVKPTEDRSKPLNIKWELHIMCRDRLW